MNARMRIGVIVAAFGALLAATQCGGSSTRPTPPPPTTEPPPGTIPGPNPIPVPSAPQTFVGAGDIAWCSTDGARLTAQLVQGIGGQVFTAGDNAYMDGSLQNYRDCYETTWGRFKDRTRPVAGNHEYDTDPSASGYYTYFGGFSGPPPGYYSYPVGDWHIIALNSALPNRGFEAGSAQLRWLEQDLIANKNKCTLAIWHHPLFTSGPNGPQNYTRDAWRLLYEHNVDVIVNGHDHLYEVFAAQDPDGRRDPARGIRQFTIGTGGAILYDVRTLAPNSERRITNTWGVLKLTLGTGYDWEFIPVAGSSQRDSGHGECH